MKRYLVLIGPKGNPRIRLEVYSTDALRCSTQHMDLVEFGERMEVVAL